MHITKENTEKLLQQTIQQYWREKTLHRCIFFRFSTVQNKPGTWFQKFLRIIESKLEDKDAEVFLCNDEDVFILAKAMMQRTLEQIQSEYEVKVNEGLPLSNLAYLFEISVHWSKIDAICEKKRIAIEHKKLQIQKKQEEEIGEKLKKIAVLPEVAKTIPKRRKQRDTVDILVVEDDFFTQRLIKNSFANRYTTHTAKDGREAISAYGLIAPDIVFLDINLPDITGHEVLGKILEVDPDAFIVMLSGNGDKENILKAVESGAKGFVGKPFTKDRLIQYTQKSPFIYEKICKETIHANPLS